MYKVLFVKEHGFIILFVFLSIAIKLCVYLVYLCILFQYAQPHNLNSYNPNRDNYSSARDVKQKSEVTAF